LEKDRPPILGLVQRGGQVVMRMLADVRQKTIRPIIEAAVAEGTRVHTDEYASYARLPAWGYRHVTVCHAHGEYARDEDGDGFCEVHINTMEGTWSLLRSWLRRTSCRSISVSSSSCTTPAVAAEHCLAPSLRLWSGDEGDEGAITPDPNKSHRV
jgi:transposase